MSIDMKISRYFIILLINSVFVLSLISGCLNNKSGESEFLPNPEIRFTPALTLIITNKYLEKSEIGNCEVVFSKTADMQNPFYRTRIGNQNWPEMKFYTENVTAGDVFYAGIFVDYDTNLEPTIGIDPIGGGYANFLDSKLDGKIEISKFNPTTVEIKLLKPIKGLAPGMNCLGTTTKPAFSWSKPAGINLFEITVYHPDKSYVYWRARTYKNALTYGDIDYSSGDIEMSAMKQIPADEKSWWCLKGYDINNELWAYSKSLNFLP